MTKNGTVILTGADTERLTALYKDFKEWEAEEKADPLYTEERAFISSITKLAPNDPEIDRFISYVIGHSSALKMLKFDYEDKPLEAWK